MQHIQYPRPFPHAENTAGKHRNVLIIEDHPVIAEMIESAFRLAGYTVTVVTACPASLAWITQAKSNPPALLLLDVDSYAWVHVEERLHDLHHAWRGTFSNNVAPPILLLTTQTHNKAALEQDGSPVLLKPFHISSLLNTARAYIEHDERRLALSERRPSSRFVYTKEGTYDALCTTTTR